MANAVAVGRLDVLGLFHHHVGIHHDQAAVGVPHEALAAGLLHQARDRGRTEAHVQDGFHHAGHRLAGAAAAGHQEGVFRVAVLLAHRLFGLAKGRGDLLLQGIGKLLAVLQIDGAELGADGETRGDGQLQTAHFRQVGALAAQTVLHAGVAVGPPGTEAINILRRHFLSLLNCRTGEMC